MQGRHGSGVYLGGDRLLTLVDEAPVDGSLQEELLVAADFCRSRRRFSRRRSRRRLRLLVILLAFLLLLILRFGIDLTL